MQGDVKQFPYRIQMQQALLEADKARNVDFSGDFQIFLENIAAVLQSIWFSDEAHFHLNGHVSKWNMHLWASEHPHNIMEITITPPKVHCDC
jgi:hypothetical protein